ncbi:MAG: hypothetical protein AB1567_04525 [bacterium]
MKIIERPEDKRFAHSVREAERVSQRIEASTTPTSPRIIKKRLIIRKRPIFQR